MKSKPVPQSHTDSIKKLLDEPVKPRGTIKTGKVKIIKK